LVRSKNGLIYVPSTITGEIRVFSLNENHLLEQLDSINIPYPVDNISEDKNGDFFAATFPQVYKWIESSKDPWNVDVPSTIFKISGAEKGVGKDRKASGITKGYVVEKFMEDGGTILSGSTTVVHDVETGRFFMGGAVTPHITICETR
jgi:arylesterase/paraoxonase